MATRAAGRSRIAGVLAAAGAALLALLILPFAIHAVNLGLDGLAGRLDGRHRLFPAGAAGAQAVMSVHMIAGAALTLFAPLQLVGVIRRRWPRLHRVCGRLLIGLVAVAAPAGLVYIARQGTIGGAWMNAGFAIYGLAMLICAAQAARFARRRQIPRHRRWALRLFVLALGSWLYRLLYTLWWIATEGLGSTPDFSGPFDLIMNFGFYLPWLALLELWFLAERRRAKSVQTVSETPAPGSTRGLDAQTRGPGSSPGRESESV